MIKYVLKSTIEYRLESVEDVKEFEKELRNQAINNGYVLSAYGYTKKETKAQGEIVDEYFVVKATLLFNVAKEPTLPVVDVEYKFTTGY